MNHYDDLQRFKDKTRNQALDFKDFSMQSQASEQGSWAILNQLLPETEANALAAGGHVSLPVPQPVTAEAFALTDVAFVSDNRVIDAIPADAPSILKGVAEQLVTTTESFPAAPAPAPAPETVRVVAPESVPADVNFSRLFAPATSTAKPTAEKNQPLNSLLERIATCR